MSRLLCATKCLNDRATLCLYTRFTQWTRTLGIAYSVWGLQWSCGGRQVRQISYLLAIAYCTWFLRLK